MDFYKPIFHYSTIDLENVPEPKCREFAEFPRDLKREHRTILYRFWFDAEKDRDQFAMALRLKFPGRVEQVLTGTEPDPKDGSWDSRVHGPYPYMVSFEWAETWNPFANRRPNIFQADDDV